MNKTVLNLDDLCEYTGFRPSYVYKLVHFKKIPYSKPLGKLLFFERAKIDAWLLSNPCKTSIELNAIASTHVTTH